MGKSLVLELNCLQLYYLLQWANCTEENVYVLLYRNAMGFDISCVSNRMKAEMKLIGRYNLKTTNELRLLIKLKSRTH